MDWLAILKLILANAPAIISTVEEGLAWAASTWVKIKASYDQPANTITKEQLLAALDRIKVEEAMIQGIP